MPVVPARGRKDEKVFTDGFGAVSGGGERDGGGSAVRVARFHMAG